MRNSPWYIAALVAFLTGAVGYIYGTSEVHSVQVHGKSIEEGQGRRSTVQLYVIETDQGRFPILKFPLIGYTSGVDQVHAGVVKGSTIRVRIGNWPPAFLGGHSRPFIMAID
jgi:hypothetical protein